MCLIGKELQKVLFKLNEKMRHLKLRALQPLFTNDEEILEEFKISGTMKRKIE